MFYAFGGDKDRIKRREANIILRREKMKMLSAIIVIVLAVWGFLNVIVSATRYYAEYRDSLIYYTGGDHILKVDANDDANRVVVDGSNSMILFDSRNKPIDIIIPGKEIPTTIKNFYFVNYYPTIMSRWMATKYALNMIWRGKREP